MDSLSNVTNKMHTFFNEAISHGEKLTRLHNVLIDLNFDEVEIKKITDYMGRIDRRRNNLFRRIICFFKNKIH